MELVTNVDRKSNADEVVVFDTKLYSLFVPVIILNVLCSAFT